MARSKGEGTYETRKADGHVRHVRERDGQRTVGPFRATRKAALDAWKTKVAKLAAETKAEQRERDDTCVGAEIYYCLFGVYESPDGLPPKTKGPWAHELAKTTYQLYKDTFKSRIANDPIALIHPEHVTLTDLEAWRTRMLTTPTNYTKFVKEEWTDETGRRRVRKVPKTITRKLPNPRSVERYADVVINVLKRSKNNCADDLAGLKLPPPKKAWLLRREKDAFLALLPPHLQLAAEMMMHGMCIGEVCLADHNWLCDTGLRVERQMSEIAGYTVERDELKRERRYRTVPLSPPLRARLADRTGRFVPMRPGNLRRDIQKALAGSKFAHLTPHDLRRSGGKWMLDAGAKLSDVARILGNDPKTLLLWYDAPDQEGMDRAVLAV